MTYLTKESALALMNACAAWRAGFTHAAAANMAEAATAETIVALGEYIDSLACIECGKPHDDIHPRYPGRTHVLDRLCSACWSRSLCTTCKGSGRVLADENFGEPQFEDCPECAGMDMEPRA